MCRGLADAFEHAFGPRQVHAADEIPVVLDKGVVRTIGQGDLPGVGLAGLVTAIAKRSEEGVATTAPARPRPSRLERHATNGESRLVR